MLNIFLVQFRFLNMSILFLQNFKILLLQNSRIQTNPLLQKLTWKSKKIPYQYSFPSNFIFKNYGNPSVYLKKNGHLCIYSSKFLKGKELRKIESSFQLKNSTLCREGPKLEKLRDLQIKDKSRPSTRNWVCDCFYLSRSCLGIAFN